MGLLLAFWFGQSFLPMTMTLGVGNLNCLEVSTLQARRDKVLDTGTSCCFPSTISSCSSPSRVHVNLISRSQKRRSVRESLPHHVRNITLSELEPPKQLSTGAGVAFGSFKEVEIIRSPQQSTYPCTGASSPQEAALHCRVCLEHGTNAGGSLCHSTQPLFCAECTPTH